MPGTVFHARHCVQCQALCSMPGTVFHARHCVQWAAHLHVQCGRAGCSRAEQKWMLQHTTVGHPTSHRRETKVHAHTARRATATHHRLCSSPGTDSAPWCGSHRNGGLGASDACRQQRRWPLEENGGAESPRPGAITCKSAMALVAPSSELKWPWSPPPPS